MKIIINHQTFDFLIGYQKDELKRTALNNLTKKIFNLSFEDWYQAGYWNEKYIPYSLFKEGRVIANASINSMDFWIGGKVKKFIQIGTVLTDETYRNQGLSRFLLRWILKEWEGKSDLVYLLANQTTLNFYQQFGFEKMNEYVFSKKVSVSTDWNSSVQKLNMDEQKNRDLLYQYAHHRNPCSLFSMNENADLVMINGIIFLKNNIYFIPSLNAVAVAIFKDSELHLLEVFGKEGLDLSEVISSLLAPGIEKVSLGFTPLNPEGWEITALNDGDALFVNSNQKEVLQEMKFMLPLLSHA